MHLICFHVILYVLISTVLPLTIRIDRGSETGIMATMHTFFRAQYDDQDDPVDSVLYGPSTQNKIERWWRELLDRMIEWRGFSKVSCRL